MDLGATRLAHVPVVTFPLLRSALLAGAILAFGLSFDEIIVTTFTAGPGITTLPIWIYQPVPAEPGADRQGGRGPGPRLDLPIYLAQRLSRTDR